MSQVQSDPFTITQISAYAEVDIPTAAINSISDTLAAANTPMKVNGPLTTIQLEVMSLVLSFPLNGIPTAVFTLSLGYDAADAAVLSATNAVAQFFTNTLHIRAYAQLTGTQHNGLPWPANPFQIWEGITTGIGVSISRQDFSFTIGSMHWLERLDASTMASALIWRGSADVLDSLLYVTTTSGQTGASELLKGIPTITTSITESVKIDSDLFTNLVEPVFAMVASNYTNTLDSKDTSTFWGKFSIQLGIPCDIDNCELLASPSVKPSEAINYNNPRAADTIARLNDPKTICPGQLPLYWLMENTEFSNIYPLPLWITEQITNGIGSATAWEKLFSLSSQLFFLIAPNVLGAAIIPGVPVLSPDLAWRTITTNEYTTLRGTGYTPRVLRGVVLLNSYTMSSMAGKSGEPEAYYPALSYYDSCMDGQFLFKVAPQWLGTGDLINTPNTVASTVPTSSTPAKKKATTTGATLANLAKESMIQTKVGSKLAHVYWLDEVYKARNAQLDGCLRFDICPGSTVNVQGIGSNLPQYSGTQITAMVSEVQVIMDAQNTQAGTVLTLSHVRSAVEGCMSVKQHPLYGTFWSGSCLVPLNPGDLDCPTQPADAYAPASSASPPASPPASPLTIVTPDGPYDPAHPAPTIVTGGSTGTPAGVSNPTPPASWPYLTPHYEGG